MSNDGTAIVVFSTSNPYAIQDISEISDAFNQCVLSGLKQDETRSILYKRLQPIYDDISSFKYKTYLS